MAKTRRLAQAPSEPVPELDELLQLFQFKFRWRESRTAAERYLTGLLAEHPNKNCDTLAAAAPLRIGSHIATLGIPPARMGGRADVSERGNASDIAQA